MKIYDFTTCFINNPVALDCLPVFGYKTDCEQTSYKITVTRGGETAYDSGVVNCGETVGIRYDGKPLISDSLYEVFLTAYGADGSAAQYAASFETGLLNASDWKGVWVNMPANFVGSSLLVRTDFNIEKEVRRARCFVAGLGWHELYVNGAKHGKALLSPAFSDPGKRVLYNTYDVTENLCIGDNVIGIMLGNGWVGQKVLLCQINIEFKDGEKREYHTGEGCWWARGGEIEENSVYGGEVYNAVKADKLWAMPQERPRWESGWMYLLRALNPPAGKLVSGYINDTEKCGEFFPVSQTSVGGGKIVYDFGRNMSGWCRIRVKGKRGGKVTLYYGEDVCADGSVNRLNLRLADCRDVYIASGDGIEEYAPRFTYHGFRYVQAECDGVELISISAEHIHTNVRVSGRFECSSDILNRLHNMAVLTELNNLQGVMTDCPQRDERFMWLNDLSSRIFQSVYNLGMERALPKVLDDISDTIDDEGRITDTAPYLTARRPADPVCVCYLLFALRCYEWYGDITTVQKHYGKLKKWTDFLIKHSDGYLMNYFYYGDWVLPFVNDSVHTDNLFVSSAYLYWHIVSMKKLAHICGNDADYAYYESEREKARIALNVRYYNADKKYYDCNTQTANAIALSLGLAPEGDRAEIASNIIRDIKARNYHSACGNQGYRHLFWTMSDMGYADDLIKMIENPEYPGWGYMVACGATTVWERWEKEMQCEMHSFNHPMFSAYDGWFYEYLGGIKLAEDSCGADKLIIAPIAVNSLSYVKSSIDTVRGKVVSDWKKTSNGTEYHIEIPLGVTAELKIAGAEKQTLLHGTYDFTVSQAQRADKAG